MMFLLREYECNIGNVWLGFLNVWQMSSENMFDRMATNVDRTPTVWPDYDFSHIADTININCCWAVQQSIDLKSSFLLKISKW